MADHTYIVAGNDPVTGFCVKNMETGEIKKYFFDISEKITIEPGTEEDMAE